MIVVAPLIVVIIAMFDGARCWAWCRPRRMDIHFATLAMPWLPINPRALMKPRAAARTVVDPFIDADVAGRLAAAESD